MVRELQARGYQVAGCDIGMSHVDQYHDFNTLVRLHKDIYDLVVHCAFHVGGRAAIDGVNTNFAKNLQLDAAMFEWAVRTKQKHVLYFSSSAAYPVSLQGKTDHLAGIFDRFDPEEAGNSYRLHESDINPDHPWGVEPDANYGWAKLTGERLAADARKSGLKVTVVRPASGCGPNQSLDYPWPSIIGRAMNGDMTLWGDPDQVRDWISVRDVVNGALAVVNSGTTDPVNLGTGIGTSMRELAKMAFAIANPGQSVPEVVSIPGPEGVFYRVLDPSRLHRYYVPVDRVEEMVRETIDILRG